MYFEPIQTSDDGSLIIRLVFLVVGLACVYLMFRTRPDIEIEFTPAGVRVRRGRVSGRLLAELELFRQQLNLTHGRLTVTRRGQQRRLACSGGLDADVEQRLRNLWHLYRE